MTTLTLAGLIESMIQNRLNEVHSALPAKIISYDADKQEAAVQPLINRLYHDDDSEIQPTIAAVPVIFPSAATGSLTFPIGVGDIVLLIFSEQSLDNWLFSDGKASVDPEDHRRFHYSDAIAIPGLYPFKKAPGGSNTDVVLRFNIGTASENKISLKPNGDIDIDTPTNYTINAASMVVNCPLTVNDDIHSTGTITGDVDVIAGTVSGKTHVHPYTDNGSPSVTSSPTP